MIIPDVNLLLFAEVSDYSQHAHAKRWWESALSGGTTVGLALPVLFGFLRIVTNPRIFGRPMPVRIAIERINLWLSRPIVQLLSPGPTHVELAFEFLRVLGTAGNLTTDVQLAVLAREHRGVIHSNDSDFSRFPNLDWVDPLK